MTLLTRNGADDNGLSTEELDDAKVSRLARRGGVAGRQATVAPTMTWAADRVFLELNACVSPDIQVRPG